MGEPKVNTSENVWGAALRAALDTAFMGDPLTSVILVKPFRKGDPIAIDEPVTEMTPRAGNDICLVKVNVGPGNPGPADAPSTSPGIGIEIWLPTPENWNGRIHNIGGLGGYDGGSHTSVTQVGWFFAAEGSAHHRLTLRGWVPLELSGAGARVRLAEAKTAFADTTLGQQWHIIAMYARGKTMRDRPRAVRR